MRVQQVANQKAIAITPSDSAFIDNTNGLFVGGAGNLTVTMANGVDVTFTGIPVGFAPLSVKKVKATGTTATNIVALY